MLKVNTDGSPSTIFSVANKYWNTAQLQIILLLIRNMVGSTQSLQFQPCPDGAPYVQRQNLQWKLNVSHKEEDKLDSNQDETFLMMTTNHSISRMSFLGGQMDMSEFGNHYTKSCKQCVAAHGLMSVRKEKLIHMFPHHIYPAYFKVKHKDTWRCPLEINSIMPDFVHETAEKKFTIP